MKADIPAMHAEFERLNQNLLEPTKELFDQMCGSSDFTSPFMNMISYMEHIGSYKIMATQYGSAMDYSTLKHLQEETGHAVLFKRHAERLNGNHLDYSAEAMLAPASARMYFSKLEAILIQRFRETDNSRLIYLYMSLLVEFRAVWAYKLLQESVDIHGLEISLDKLLAEEHGHLHSMVRRLDEDGLYKLEDVRELWKEEKILFTRLMNTVSELYWKSEKQKAERLAVDNLQGKIQMQVQEHAV